jgi:TetR/AcrR family transcriptional repressor of nem operon
MSKGEMTRQRIIEQAAPLFNQRGFAGCSMQDVLDATGLEKGGLYRHFASKEELAAEAFSYALANAVKVRTHNLGNIEGALDQLRYVVTRFVEGPSAMVGGCPLMNTAIDSDDGNPTLRQLARKGIQDWKARLCLIVEQGIQAGEIRDDVDAGRIANTIIATLEGALMISRLEGDRSALRDAQASLNIVLNELPPQHSHTVRITAKPKTSKSSRQR